METTDKRKRLARKLQYGTEDLSKGYNLTGALSSLKGLMPDLNKDRSGNATEIDSAVYGDMGSDPIGRLLGDISGNKTASAVDNIRNGVATFDQVRNNDNLYNAWNNVQLKRNVDASFKASDILDNLDASGQGAINGSKYGGAWGALIGGIAGGVTNLASQLSRGRRARKINSAIDEANRQTLENYYGQAMANTQNSIRDAYKYGNFAAYGGRMMQDGGLMASPDGLTNGVTEFNTGGTHEQNPYGGIQQGVASDGLPNLVEEGEVKYKDYIYSARLHATGKLLDEYNLPKKYEGMTFGEIARKLQKGSEERENDPVSLNGLNAVMQRLADAQEKVRANKRRNELKRALDRMTPEQMQAMQAQMMEPVQQQPGMEGMYGMQPMQEMGPMQPMDGMYADGGNIHIAPSRRGTFTEAARRHGMGVQEFARHVLANKESYSPAMVKKANFAHNAAGWKHQYGGSVGGNKSDYDYIYDSIENDRIQRENEILDEVVAISSDPYYYSPVLKGTYTAPEPTAASTNLSRPERNGKDLKGWYDNLTPAQRAKLLSHIPVYASGAQVLADSMWLTNRKDYTASNELRGLSRQYAPVAAPLISGRKAYENIDTNLPVENAYANAAAMRNALTNTANGNRANLAAALSRYNQAATEAVQKAYMDAQAANLASRNRTDENNRSIDLANSGLVSNYDKINLDTLNRRLNMLSSAAVMDDQMRSGRNAALQANRDQMIRNLGEIGKEGLNEAMVVAMAERGLFGPGMASYLKDLGYSPMYISQLERADAEAKRRNGIG